MFPTCLDQCFNTGVLLTWLMLQVGFWSLFRGSRQRRSARTLRSRRATSRGSSALWREATARRALLTNPASLKCQLKTGTGSCGRWPQQHGVNNTSTTSSTPPSTLPAECQQISRVVAVSFIQSSEKKQKCSLDGDGLWCWPDWCLVTLSRTVVWMGMVCDVDQIGVLSH